MMTRAELQRMLRMLEVAVANAGWVSAAPSVATTTSPKPVAH
jgi:hypothetical protein